MTEAEVIDRINSTIKKNGKNAITGDEMNFVLKAIIQLIADAGGTVNWGDIEGTIADQLDLIALLDDKVDVVSGKGLSTNDFTDALKTKLDGIEAGAEVNVKADWNATSGDAEILNKPTIPDPSDFVSKSDYTPAHSLLVQQSGTGSPTAVSIGNDEILGRKSGGGSNIEGLSVSEVKSILGYTLEDLGIFRAKLTSGNQTTTTNFTQIAITELKVTPTINKRYKITAQLHLGCSGTGGVRVGISIPTGANIFITGFGTGQPGSTNSLMSFINASGQLFQNPYVTLNSTNGMCIINGEIEMGATAGDVQLTFNSFTNGQTSTVFQLSTHLQLEEI
jgi:hypothetical protein